MTFVLSFCIKYSSESIVFPLTLVNDQLDAQFFNFIIRLLQTSACFEQRRACHVEVK